MSTDPQLIHQKQGAQAMSDLRTVAIYSNGAGSTRVRLADWVDHLQLQPQAEHYIGEPNAGVSTLVRNRAKILAAERHLRRLDPRHEVVLMSREASPLSRGGLEVRLLKSAARGVFDIDDALFNDTSLRRRALGSGTKFQRSAAAADCVIAGSEYLAEWAAQFNGNVQLIPSCVEPGDYVLARSERASSPLIVWLGSRSTESYLVPIIPALQELHRRTGARIKIISSAADNPSLSPLADMMIRQPWSKETVSTDLADADVAIAPLTDTPFARGKCAYKILQYGCAALPIVGSPVGANKQALERLNGLAANSHDEWVDAIEALLAEPTRESEIRRNQARRGVVEHYSFGAWAERWKSAVGLP